MPITRFITVRFVTPSCKYKTLIDFISAYSFNIVKPLLTRDTDSTLSTRFLILVLKVNKEYIIHGRCKSGHIVF